MSLAALICGVYALWSLWTVAPWWLELTLMVVVLWSFLPVPLERMALARDDFAKARMWRWVGILTNGTLIGTAVVAWQHSHGVH